MRTYTPHTDYLVLEGLHALDDKLTNTLNLYRDYPVTREELKARETELVAYYTKRRAAVRRLIRRYRNR